MSKLYSAISGLYANDVKIRDIIGVSGYNVESVGSIDARLQAISGALTTANSSAYAGLSAAVPANGLTVGAIDSNNMQEIKIDLADGANAGTVLSSDDVSISSGKMTVTQADKVKHSFSIFGNSFDGSADVSLSAGNFLSFANGKLNVESSEITETGANLAVASAVFKAVKDAKDNVIDQLSSVSGGLDTRLDTIEGDGVGSINAALSSAKQYTDALSTALVGSATADYDTFAEVETAIKSNDADISYISGVLNGYTTEGSISAAIKALKDTGADSALTGITAGYGIKASDVTAHNVTISADFSQLKLEKLTGDVGDFAAKYALKDTNGNQLGDTIDLVKDQFLSSVQYLSASHSLKFTWALANGNPSETTIDVNDLYDSYTSGNGVDVDNATNKIAVKKDTTNSESFFFVGESGVGVSGIQTAINTAANTAAGNISALEGKLSSAFVADKVVLGAADGITSSAFTVGLSGVNAVTTANCATANVIAQETTVKATAKALIGAESDDDLNAWSGDATTEGSLAYLMTQINALNI